MHEGQKVAGAASCRRGCTHGHGLQLAVGVAACLAGLAGCATLGASPRSSPGTTGPAQVLGRFVRVGSAPRVPGGATFLGPASGSDEVELDVALRPRDPAALARFANAVSTPGSGDFRRYLHPGAFGARFGATAATVRAATTALRTLGLEVGPIAGNRLLIKASATVTTAEHAFATTIARYRLASGAIGYANLSAPRIPRALAGAIQAVVGLSDLAPSYPVSLERPGPRTLQRARKAPEASTDGAGAPEPCAAASTVASASDAYTADQLASAYGFNGLYAAGDFGAGETIAIFELEPFSEPDVQAYDECYFPDQAAAMASGRHVLYVDGAVNGVPNDVESTLDVEDVSSFAPGATLDVYEGPNNGGTGPLDVLSAIVSQDHAQVITTSWGNCEPQDGGAEVVAIEANLLEQAAAQGQSVVAASGDDGSTDCGVPSGNQLPVATVDDPGSQPYVTSVGGTSLTAIGPPPTESVWNNTDGASGGGISSNWAMPAYQSDAPASLGVIKPYSSPGPCGAPTGYCRQVPDVSADADPNTGLVIDWGSWGGWTSVGGTSLAAPLWAALVALTDAWPTCSAHPVGFLNPALYSIAASGGYASALNDVTRGDNHLSSIANWWRYPATVGYDLASGLGTPDAANPSGGGLVTRLCALPESGGVQYASPTKSSITASDHTVDAVSTAFTTITVTLRTRFGLPVASKRVWLVATTDPRAAMRTTIRPRSGTTNLKGVAIFEVSDTTIQKVIYSATDLTDGVLLYPSVTVDYVNP
ncbi:MAG: protease pro-enzyme activation domain-containing protein [Acidimicrobiales bacterium]